MDTGAPGDELARLLNHIRAHPDSEAYWLALAIHLDDNGENDLATAIRSHWPALRDNLAAGLTLEATLAFRARDVRRIVWQAREREEPVLSGES